MTSRILPTRRRAGRVLRGGALLLCVLSATCSRGPAAPSGADPTATVAQPLRPSVTFPVGSLIIPMDNTGGGAGAQQPAALRAYGLVYRLLLQNINVYWAVAEAKAFNGQDVCARTTIQGGDQTPTARTYAGGPFIVHANDQAAALAVLAELNNGEELLPKMPIVTPDLRGPWVAPNVVVHVAAAPVVGDCGSTVMNPPAPAFTAEIARTMNAAPRIAVLADGAEDIAFGYLNAAGIRDSANQRWPAARDANGLYPTSPDVLSLAEDGDGGVAMGVGTRFRGALLRGDGTPAFCHMTSMHYTPSPNTVPVAEVVSQVSAWLTSNPSTHAYMQCEAINIFENNASGRFLTVGGAAGIVGGSVGSSYDVRAPGDPLAQYVEAYSADTGAIGRIDLASGSSYRPTTTSLVVQRNAPGQGQAYWMSGYAFGTMANGRVTYLAGHDFNTNPDVSSLTTRAQQNGVRLMLNSLLDSPCATSEGQATPAVTASGPTLTNQSSATYAFNVANGGPGVADNATLRYTLPAGYTFTSATGTSSFDMGTRTVTWTLGNVKPNQPQSVTVTVGIAADGSYANSATLTYFASLTQRTLTSNTVTTVRDTVRPDTTITSGPAEGSAQASSSATFGFSSDDPAATFECRVDSQAFAPCTSTNTVTGLPDGSHIYQVRARDAAGNLDDTPAQRTFTVDTTPPDTQLDSGPAAGASVSSTSATFTFSAPMEPGTTTFECQLDGGGFTACTSPAVRSGLSQGPHTFQVRARDAVGNVDPTPASRTWTVDTVSPETQLDSGPIANSIVSSTSATFTFSAPMEPGTTTFQCQLDSGGFAPCTTPRELTGLAQGPHTFEVRAVDAAGNIDATPASRTWTVDTVVPGAPAITTPTNGSSVPSTTVTVTGTAEPGALVRLFLDGVAAGTTTANGSGEWTRQLMNVSEGPHQLRAQAQDAAGNVSALSAVTTFTVDTVAPAAPVVVAPANGARTNNARPTVTGTAEPNATVIVRIDDNVVGTTTANASGAFTLNLSVDLSNGSHAVNTTATDAASNTSAVSNTNTFIVDTVAPPAPTITQPTANQLLATGRPTITGQAEPNANVELRVDGSVVATVPAGPTGDFSYTLTAGQTLSDGGHNVTARAVDQAGNLGPTSAPTNFTVDTTAPAAPVIVIPTAGQRTNNPRITITGTAEGQSFVRVIIDSVLYGTVGANFSGDWSFTPSAAQALSEGNHTVVAQGVDAAGNVGGSSAPRAFTVDLTAPTPPQILTPPSGTRTNDSTPTVTGLAEPLARVDLFVDGVLGGTATADASGNWTITLGVLAEGTRTLTARAIDQATNTSGLSAPSTLIIDISAPAAPVIATPTEGSRTSDNTPDVTGTAEANSTVTVFIGGVPAGTAAAGASGSWIFTVATPLSEGPHVVTARARDGAGNDSPLSAGRNFIVDTTAPGAPTILAPLNGSTTNDNTPLVSGTAEPNATVRLFRDGTQVATTVADGAGAWSVGLSALPDGTYVLRAQAVDAAGNAGPLSNTTSFTIDTTRPAPPTVSTPADGSRSNTGRPTVTGTAEPGATVTIRFDGIVAGTAIASLAGTYLFTPTATLVDGPHNVTATATDAGGNVSEPSAPNNFVVDTQAPAAPVITAPTQGQVLGTSRPTFTGTAEPNATVEVRVDGVLLGSAAANGAGAWSFTPSAGQPISDGSHSVVARAVDLAGNTGPSSTAVSFIIDTQAPAAPVVLVPVNGSRSNDTTPTISGTAEAGSSVTVLVDGAPVGTVPANAQGAWTYTLTAGQALNDGNHTASARATDAGGNQSATAAPVSFVVDTLAPTAPVITSPANNARLNTPTPVVSGTSEPGATVTVFVNGAQTIVTTANGSGGWSTTLPTQTDGAKALTARARDTAGNDSVLSNTVNVIIDTAAPAAPVITAPVDGAQLATRTPLITGTAEPASTVTVFDGPTVLGTAVAAGDGTWSLQVPAGSPLAEGPHTLTARATDLAGNLGPVSAPVTVTVDTVAPSAPVITSPTPAQVLSQSRPTFTGTAETGATVTVTVDGDVIGSTVAGAGGLWSLTPTTDLDDGSHIVGATARDAAGNTSAPATPVQFSIDTSAPDRVVIASPSNGAQLPTATPTVSGTAEPLSTVRVFVDGALVGQTVALPDGTWSLPLTTPLSEGPHVLTAQATDGGGNVGPLSDPVNIVVDLTPPAAPVTVTPANASRVTTATPAITGTAGAGESLIVRVDGNVVGTVTANASGAWTYTLTSGQTLAEGTHSANALARDAAGNTSVSSNTNTFTVDTIAPSPPVVLVPAANSVSNNTRPTVSGTAEPNASVRVFIDGTLLGTVPADASGNWTYTLTAPQALTEGPHQASAVAVDAAGNPSAASPSVPFTVDLTAPTAPTVTAPTEGQRVNTPRPVITGTAEPGSTVTVTLDGVPAGTTVAGPDGSFTFTPPAPLADGPHVVTATARDPAGNTSPASTARNFVVDTAAPAAPVITAPTEGAVIGNRTPTIEGTAEAGATVSVSVDGAPLGQAIANASGAWSYALTPAQALASGPHTAVATARDVAGNTSAASAPRNFVVDTQAPNAPVVTAPTDGQRTNDTTPEIRGTAEPSSTVEILIGGVPVGTATATPEGTFTFTPSTPLLEGPHTITARATDPAGNTSGLSAPVTVVIDLTPPAPPVIVAPTSGSSTSDRTPEVRGTGEPGATITVLVDGLPVGTAVVTPAGTWTFVVPDAEALTEGPHTLTAEATDPAGNPSGASAPVEITVDVTAPERPLIERPTENAIVATNTPTIAGSAEPGARVEVRVDGTLVGTVPADVVGDWSYTLTPAQGLTAGPHSATAEAVDDAGNRSGPTEPRPFVVDVNAPNAPIITTPTDGQRTNATTPPIGGTAEPGTTISVFLDGRPIGTATTNPDGTWSLTPTEPLAEGTYVARAVATDTAGNPSAASTPVSFTVDTQAPAAPIITQPTEGQVVGTSRPTFRGTAEPNSTVQLTLGGAPFGSALTDPSGAWSFTPAPAQALTDGPYTVTATARDEAGNVSPASPPRAFTVDTSLPDRPTITAPVDGDALPTSTPTIRGTAEPGSRVTVVVDGQTVGEVIASPAGEWTYPLTPGQALADGPHVVSATARDEAGNLSGESEPVGFDVDTNAPAAPRITAPQDGSRTSNRTPVIQGTAEPGSTVTVLIDGVPAGTAPVDPTGAWTFTPSTPLTDGPHAITARAADEAGNQSGLTPPVNVVVDTTAPAAPVITSPVDGAISNNPTPTITGTAEPGATVEVIVDGRPVGRATADNEGNWRYTLTQSQALPEGEHTVVARAIDPVGNEGPASPPTTFTVDTTVPQPPEITSPRAGSSTRDDTPTITGTAEPGIRVLIYVDDVLIGQTTAGVDGRWSFTPSEAQALSEGEHIIEARAVDPSGNRSLPSAPVDITIDRTNPVTPTITSPAPGSTTNETTPTIRGTGEPGTTVDVFIDGAPVGTATVGPDGTWSLPLSPAQALPDGTHTVTAQGRDDAGNVSAPSAPTTFTVRGGPPTTPTITSPQTGSATQDNTPEIRGTGQPGTTIDVLIDGGLVGTTTVDNNGNWSFTPTTPLPEGEHVITTRARDGAGRTSDLSAPVRVTVDTVGPRAPTLDPQPPVTRDNTPTVSGTAEPGTTVEVSVDGRPVGTAMVNPDGTWTFDLPPQTDGPHTVTVVAVDPAGNRSPPTTGTVNVDTRALEPPVITSPQMDALHLANPVLAGTGIAGALVRVRLDGVALPGTRVLGNGTWRIVLPETPTLANGDHTIVATQEVDGRVSGDSNAVTFAMGFAQGAGFVCSAPTNSAPSLGALWLVALALALSLAYRRRRAAPRGPVQRR